MSASGDEALRASSPLAVTSRDGTLSVPVPNDYPITPGLPQLMVLEALARATPVNSAAVVRVVHTCSSTPVT